MTLQHVVAIQERLLAIGLHPHLVFGVLGKIVQTGDMQLHLAGLGELAEAGASANQLVLADVGSHLQNLRIDVVDAVLVEAEDILAVLAVNQELDVAAEKLCQLPKEGLGLVLCQRPHFYYLVIVYYVLIIIANNTDARVPQSTFFPTNCVYCRRSVTV